MEYVKDPLLAFMISFIFVTGVFIGFADLIPKRLVTVWQIFINRKVKIKKEYYGI